MRPRSINNSTVDSSRMCVLTRFVVAAASGTACRYHGAHRDRAKRSAGGGDCGSCRCGRHRGLRRREPARPGRESVMQSDDFADEDLGSDCIVGNVYMRVIEVWYS